ncbi:hypothetical protein HT031_004160 [Scenedesmus sp. PABB004]|nr:hypothetical protein HT031_004160 [Scenedesmus sp. PABB004]
MALPAPAPGARALGARPASAPGRPLGLARPAAGSSCAAAAGGAALRGAPRRGGAHVLEAAAAAPRPAALPERLEASSSSSASGSSPPRRTRSRSGRGGGAPGAAPAAAAAAASARREPAAVAAPAPPAGVAPEHLSALLVSAAGHGAAAAAAADAAAAAAGLALAGAPHGAPPAPDECETRTGRRLSDAGWQLMQAVLAAGSWQELARLVEARPGDFSAQHCAAALHRLAALWQAQEAGAGAARGARAELRLQLPDVQALARALLAGLQRQASDAEARDVADALQAAVVLRLALAAPAAGERQRGGADAAPRRGGAPHAAGAGAEGLGDALLQRSQALLRAGKVKPLQLARVLWGLTQLGVAPDRDWWAAALEASAGQMQAQLDAPRQHGAAAEQEQQQQSERGRVHNPRTLACMGWAVAKLRAPAPAAWWALYRAATAHQLPAMEPRQLANCAWALATARSAPGAAWMAAFWDASGAALGGFSPQGLATVLWAAAALGEAPPRGWMRGFGAASAAAMPGFSAQQLSMTLWALGRLSRARQQGRPQAQAQQQQQQQQQQQPQVQQQQQQQQQQHELEPDGAEPPSAAWVDQAWVQLARVEGELRPQGLACVLWALVQLRAPVPEQRLQQLEVLAGEVLRGADPQGLVVITWALGVLRGPATGRAVVQRLRRHCQHHHQQLAASLTPQGLLMLLHGLARMRAWQPQSFKDQLLLLADATLQRGLYDGSGGGGGARTALRASELPCVLLSLTQLRVALPTALLLRCEAALLPALPALPAGELARCVFALGGARHNPSPEFLEAVLAALDARLGACSALDVAHLLYGLAAMGGAADQLAAPAHQERLQRLLAAAEQAVPRMDQACLGMLMWALAALRLRPAEPLLHGVLAATSAALPHMTLLSLTSVLAALQALNYLPPLAWMVETCSAARARLGDGGGARPAARRASARRLEEAVAWFNAAVAAQQPGGPPPAGGRAGAPPPGRAGLLPGGANSEAVLAAAVGVAAAVAQTWHP